MARAARKSAPKPAKVKTVRPKQAKGKASAKSKAGAKAFVRILNCVPSRDTDKDWRVDHALAAGVLAAAPIRQSKDLREEWWWINDQGDTGACVGWATAGSLLRWHFVKSGRLSPD